MSFIVQTSIEISKSDDPPHIQAPFKAKRVGAFTSLDKHHYEEVAIGERSRANIRVEKKDSWTDIEYMLHYTEDEAKMIKAWMMTDFFPTVNIRLSGSTHTLSTEGAPLDFDDDINCVKHWDRLFVFQNGFDAAWLGNNYIQVLTPENLRRTVLYRRRDRSRLEFAFIWRRDQIEKGLYGLRLRVNNVSNP